MWDLSSRLVAIDLMSDPTDSFDSTVREAVLRFQRSRRLHDDGVCDASTWESLVEAGFQLGDRLIFLTGPMIRGDDVADLQVRLGSLGFDAGRVDGIFGPATELAVTDFQQNVGLVPDRVCGPETVAMLRRLKHRTATTTVAGVRERRSLKRRAAELGTVRVALVHDGSAHQIIGITGTDLRSLGAQVAVLTAPTWKEMAIEVNAFATDLCVAIELTDDVCCEAAYFETTGYSSSGGQLLADLVVRELPTTPAWPLGRLVGMSLPILRETKPPTVALRLGPITEVNDHRTLVASAIATGVLRWLEAISTIDLTAPTLQV